MSELNYVTIFMRLKAMTGPVGSVRPEEVEYIKLVIDRGDHIRAGFDLTFNNDYSLIRKTEWPITLPKA